MTEPRLRAVNDDFNPWGLETEDRTAATYDPADFHIASVNKHDHSSSVTFRAPGEVISELARMVASGDFPMYKTKSDFMRDAIVHRMHWLADNYDNEKMRQWVTRQSSLARLDARRDEVEELSRLVEGWKVDVARARDMKDTWAIGHAKVMLAEDVAQVRDPYKSRLREILETLE